MGRDANLLIAEALFSTGPTREGSRDNYQLAVRAYSRRMKGSPVLNTMEIGTAERRRKIRYPVVEPAYIEIRRGEHTALATVGQTLNLSSSGALLRLNAQLQLGDAVELTILWPVQVDGPIQLKFFASGIVVRIEPGGAALQLSTNEFRTCRAAEPNQLRRMATTIQTSSAPSA